MFPRLIRCCSRLLRIVTCAIRNPNAGIRKVSLTNETQNKLKRRVSNKNYTVSRPVFTAARFRNQVSTKQYQNLVQWEYVNIFRKNKFSVKWMFFLSLLESILNHSQPKKKSKQKTTKPHTQKTPQKPKTLAILAHFSNTK